MIDDYGKAGLAAAAFAAAVLCYMASCGVARAAEVEIRWQHPGGDPRPYDAMSICDEARCVALALDQLCASGATCSAVADLEPGEREVWLVAGSGSAQSAASNRRTLSIPEPPPPLDPVWCLATPACRHDADGDGWVTSTDFADFLRVFGGSWQRP